MRIVGIVAEYNPFHLGHAYHLQEAKRLSGADYAVVVMSTCFTQRGDAALLSPSARARMALNAGADAVFALPAQWAVRDAEHFALGGVSLLAGLGCDALSFGSESTDVAMMRQCAALLENPSAALQESLAGYMASGIPYPAALSSAMDRQLPGAAPLLSTPNATLSICYLRALIRLQATMEIYPVRRIGAYHASDLRAAMPSATALRGAITRGDWGSARAAMPDESFAELDTAALAGHLHRPEALDPALLYRLRTMTDQEYAALPDISEGIETRLADAAQVTCTREQLLQVAKTRRYPYARLSRLTTHALLGMTHQQLAAEATPPCAWLLGMRADARPLMKELKGRSRLPILSKAADADRSAPWFILEQRAYDLWALGAGLPSGLAMTQGVTIV